MGLLDKLKRELPGGSSLENAARVDAEVLSVQRALGRRTTSGGLFAAQRTMTRFKVAMEVRPPGGAPFQAETHVWGNVEPLPGQAMTVAVGADGAVAGVIESPEQRYDREVAGRAVRLRSSGTRVHATATSVTETGATRGEEVELTMSFEAVPPATGTWEKRLFCHPVQAPLVGDPALVIVAPEDTADYIVMTGRMGATVLGHEEIAAQFDAREAENFELRWQ